MAPDIEAKFKDLFTRGEWILSGGGSAHFLISEIGDQVRIVPEGSKTDNSYLISFDQIRIIMDNYDAIDIRSITKSVSSILLEHGKSSTIQVYVFGLVREFIARLKLSTDGSLTEYENNFNQRVAASAKDGQQERNERLAAANKTPGQMMTNVRIFMRNPDVVAAVLERADGICEACGEAAPFHRKSDNSPYLEVHHKVRLADNGYDTVENAEALCPNCHRKAHYG